MAVELRIEGDAMKALQRKLRTFDSKEFRRDLYRELRIEAMPLVQDARDAARDDLPSTGGLNERVASRSMAVGITQGGVRIRVKGVDANSTNRGRLRHPVYGNRQNWVTQQIKPGWFTDRMRREAPKVRPGLIRAMDRAAARIARG